MNIYTIVVTYNGEKWAERCFGSLVNSDIENHTILAIDNGSTDKTLDIIRRKFPQVKIIETGENLGFGKANNIGLSLAYKNNADYVFLINQDAWVDSNQTLKQMVNIHEKNPDYGIISPVHLNADRTLDKGFSNYVKAGVDNSFLLDSLSRNISRDAYPVKFVNAASWLISKKCISRNGGFMPAFPHYGEDRNYCHRVINSDLKIGIVPGILMVHDRGNREGRKTDKSFKFRKNIAYVDILISITTSCSNSIFIFFSKTLFELLKKIWYKKSQPFAVIYLILAYLKILYNLRDIYHQVLLSKTKDSHFLDFNIYN